MGNLDYELSHLLVPFNFSSAACRAYTYAIRLAQAVSADLVILHVLKTVPGIAPYHDEQCRALLELGRMASLAQDAGLRVEHRLISGIPDLAILEMAQETAADMIIMAHMAVPAGTGFSSAARPPRSFNRPRVPC